MEKLAVRDLLWDAVYRYVAQTVRQHDKQEDYQQPAEWRTPEYVIFILFRFVLRSHLILRDLRKKF